MNIKQTLKGTKINVSVIMVTHVVIHISEIEMINKKAEGKIQASGVMYTRQDVM